jgi:LDH2 family malate/lactate/ureidoglycolate dehydrogenase
MSGNVVDWKTITAFITEAFVRYGVPPEDAAICADVILESDRRGIKSHGVNRFKPFYIDRIVAGIQNPVTDPEVVKETETTAVIDAHDGMGQVAAYRAMELAIKKAKEHGTGAVAVMNSCHYGIAGYYTSMAARAGCVGITCTNTRPAIAPTFGIENMLGTNPISFAMPTDEAFDFNLDCATSIIQRGKVEVKARFGEPLPEGLVIGHDGQYLTDSREILKGLQAGTAALCPLGGAGEERAGYKGYGLSTVVEILSAAFTGGPFLKQLSGLAPDGSAVRFHLGHFFMAVDTEHFCGEAVFRKTAGDICRSLRASARAPGQERIYTAGEKEYEAKLSNTAGVAINESVQKEFSAVRDDLGLPFVFPWEE